MTCTHEFIRMTYRDGTTKQGLRFPDTFEDEHGVIQIDPDLVSVRCDDCRYQFGLGKANGEPPIEVLLDNWYWFDAGDLKSEICWSLPWFDQPRVTTERVESALADAGAEHEPADGWDERVVEATREARAAERFAGLLAEQERISAQEGVGHDPWLDATPTKEEEQACEEAATATRPWEAE